MHSDVRVTAARRNGSSGIQGTVPLRENLQPQSMSNLQSASDQIARLKLNHHNLRQFDAKREVSLDSVGSIKRSKGKQKEKESVDDIPFAPDFVDGDAAIGPQINMVRAYVHQVQPSDTLPHILLTYGISSEAFKRANRMWANDSIFTRKVVYLPVSECHRDFEAYESPDLISMDDEDGSAEEPVHEQEEVSRVVVPDVGKVDVVTVPSRFLTYFPPSSVPPPSSSFPPRFQSHRHSEMPLRNVHTNDMLGAGVAGAGHIDTTSQLPFRRSTDSVGSVTASIEDWVSRNWREWKAKRYERSSLDERWINLR